MTRRPVIALLTDFGTQDWYVGALRGVLLSRCPQARLLDISHDIPPQDVLAGAFTLAAVAPWFPPGTVFLAVVDPGVGSARALLAARAHGQCFIGPDNGLLTLALARAVRPTIVRLTNRRYWAADLSRTFHGRDVLATVAAAVVSGVPLARLGVPLARLTPLEMPIPRRRGRALTGAVIHIDAFGNLITNLPASALAGGRAAVRYQRRPVRVVSSYTQGNAQELIAVVNSQGLVELAIREGSAARVFHVKRGDHVEVRPCS